MGCRILFVDDHADTCRAFALLLEMHGHTVTCAMSCAEAIECATGAVFDLLIVDVAMPDGNGMDLLARIRRIYPIEGIVISGHGLPGDVAKAEDAGFLRHLLKPVEAVDLPRIIEEIADCSQK